MNKINLKIAIIACLSLVSVTIINAQTGVYNGSPSSFMQLHGNANWVQPMYTTSAGSPHASTNGMQGFTTTHDGSGNHSHAYVTLNANGTSGTNCSACFEATPGSNVYNRHLNVMPQSWDGSGGFVDTVIQIGDRFTSTGCGGNKCQKLTYAFKPDTNNPVLLLNYSMVLQNVVNSTHDFAQNPRVEITVTDMNGNLLQLPSIGNRCYYPNDYYTGYNQNNFTANVNGNFGPHGIWDNEYNDNPNYQPNTNWPYSKYVFAAPGSGGPGYVEMTPCFVDPDFEPIRCPSGQLTSSCCNTGYEVVAYPYTIVAFNLTSQARAGQTVKLQIHKHGCLPSAHWAEMYFTAKMVPGKIQGNVCNADTNIVFSVPWGFKTYEWFAGFDANTKFPIADFSGNRNFTLNRNTDQVYPYYCCIMQSFTGVPFLYEANLTLYDLQANMTWEQYGGDCAYNVRFCDSSVVCKMVPEVVNNVLTGQYSRDYMNSWHRKWLYKDANGVVHPLDGGHPNDACFNYTFQNVDANSVVPVGLVIWDNDNTCYSDTLWTDITFEERFVTPAEKTDTIINCEETVVYDAATFGNTYTWNSPGTRPVVYQGATWNGCDSTVMVTYIVQKPRINEVLSSDVFCDEFYTTLSVNANVDPVSYQWSYSNNGDTTFNEGVDPTAATIIVTKPGKYTVKIIDDGGCEATNEITIDACKPFMNLPNAITPSNCDGLNDCLELVQRDLLQNVEFSIYNRQGELVFYTTDKYFCWDGTINGKLYTNVTYNWKLKVVDYNNIETMYKGSTIVL